MNLFFLFSLFSVIHGAPVPNFPFPSCNTSEFSHNSPYEASLDNLLLLYSKVARPVPKFFNTSAGTDSDLVYGLLWCYAYSTDDQCFNCLQAALKDIRMYCMNKHDAWVWEEYCLFRYSTQIFFGQLNVSGNIRTKNQKNLAEPEKLRYRLNGTLHNLTVLAAFNTSFHMHAMGLMPYMPNDPIHAFVECTKDLSPMDCYTCLESSTKELLAPYYFDKGARLLGRSCYLRYETYKLDRDENGSDNSQTKANPMPRKWKIAVIAIGSGTVLLAAAGCFVYFLVLRNRRRKISSSGNQEMRIRDEYDWDSLQKQLDHPEECPFVEMKIIEQATDNFSPLNKLGEGGFGPVFKGSLSDGQEIAVKRLSTNSDQGPEEFMNEVLLIHKLQHVNLVRLLGFSAQEEEKLLIYEYMPNGSLEGFLYERNRAKLDWSTRLSIIKGVARGMLYLHQDSRLNIIHRDLKPSNVLLDANLNPKISDFGTARIFEASEGEVNTAKVVGTYGYMAPEFAMEGFYSIKSDVFSFGVLLLEIITGKQNVGFHRTRLAPSLLSYAWNLWDKGKGHELMDGFLANSCPEEEFLRCMHVGLLCVQRDAQDRPTMGSVVVMLNGENVCTRHPEQPAFTVGKFDDHYQTCVNNLSQNLLTISDVLPR